MFFIYSAKLVLNNKNFDGTIDFFVLKNLQKELKKLGKNIAITEIFESLSNMDMEVLTVFLMQTILRKTDTTEEIISEAFMEDENTTNKFEVCFKYINELMEECMPGREEKEESEFEDIPDFSIKNKEDWDFPFMEHLWTTILKRNNFWETTPKNFFEQMEVHRRLHAPKEDNKVEEL